MAWAINGKAACTYDKYFMHTSDAIIKSHPAHVIVLAEIW